MSCWKKIRAILRSMTYSPMLCVGEYVIFFLKKPCNSIELCSVVKRAIEIKKAEDMVATMTKKRINLERTLKDKEMEEKLRQADKMVSLDTIRKILQINR